MPQKKGKYYAKVLVKDYKEHIKAHKDIIEKMKTILKSTYDSFLLECTHDSFTMPENALEKYWKEVYIPKKSGGYRQIMIPDQRLQFYFKSILKYFNSVHEIGSQIMKDPIQRKRLYQVANYFQFNKTYYLDNWLTENNTSHGFEKHKSIVSHTQKHKDSKYFFKTDIKGAFPSINQRDVNSILSIYLQMSFIVIKTYGNLIYGKDIYKNYKLIKNYSNQIANMYSNILAPQEELLTGTSLSPFILNQYLLSFDKRLNTYCNKRGYIYSRYADDILISSSKALPREVRNYVRYNLQDFHMVMNDKKTKFQTYKQKNVITGIVVSYNKETCQGDVGIGYDKFNQLKKSLYQLPKMSDKERNQTLGMLSYLESVNKERADYLKKKYAKQLESL